MNGGASELCFGESLVPEFGLDFSFPEERPAKVITETTVYMAIQLVCLAGF